MRLLAPPAALLLFAIPPGLAAEAPFPPGRYLVDAERTTVHFTVKQFPFGHYEGKFVNPTGAVTIDPDHDRRADIDITFPVEQLTTGDSFTDDMLKGSNFFDAAQFPTARFVATDVPLGGDSIAVHGKLTMHGVTRTVSVSARLADIQTEADTGQSTLHFTGETAIKRSDFKMGFGRPFVSNRVTLTIDAHFRLA
jgi:polyisoprenoid-binding protein YceI